MQPDEHCSFPLNAYRVEGNHDEGAGMRGITALTVMAVLALGGCSAVSGEPTGSGSPSGEPKPGAEAKPAGKMGTGTAPQERAEHRDINVTAGWGRLSCTSRASTTSRTRRRLPSS
jgi:hypothetical protein